MPAERPAWPGPDPEPTQPGWLPWPAAHVPADPEREPVAYIVSEAPELQPLAFVLAEEISAITGVRPEIPEQASSSGGIHLCLASSMHGYRFDVSSRGAVVEGSDYAAVAMGTATLLQTLDNRRRLPHGAVADLPRAAYRGVSIDCARHPQPIRTLRQVIEMCRFYKVRFVQLHLTDDEAFTFPSKTCADATPKLHYSRQELEDLEEFARIRGVALVPELDVPGHCAALVRSNPALFGLRDHEKNPSLIHMGREAVYEALDELVGEICAVFRCSPWFHIGGDEACLDHVEDDPEVVDYMRAQGIGSARELYRYFLGRMHDIVRRHGKETLVWECFGPEGEVEVPKDIVVMCWETKSHRPDELLAAGYRVINTSWQPLYVVGGGRKTGEGLIKSWTPREIHGWNMHRWEHFESDAPSFGGLDVPADSAVLGAQMCVWEQVAAAVVPDLRDRLPAMAERLWNPEAPGGFASFARRLEQQDARLERLLQHVAALP